MNGIVIPFPRAAAGREELGDAMRMFKDPEIRLLLANETDWDAWAVEWAEMQMQRPRSAEGKKITRVEGGCEPVLFGWQALADPNARECTITEGEIDALTAHDYGCPAPFSVPFGW